MINGLCYVTIASDASVGSKSTGFAYYIRDDSGTTKHAWRSSRRVISSTFAELEAMVAALRVVAERDYQNPILIYYCDNMTAIHCMIGKVSQVYTITKYLDEIKDIRELTSKFVMVDARHVKSHTKNMGKNYFMNDWCDINARAMMRNNRFYSEKLDGYKERRRARHIPDRRETSQD